MTIPMYNPRPTLQPRSRRPNSATASASVPPPGPTTTTTTTTAAPKANNPTTMPEPTAAAPATKRTAAETHDSDREDSTPKRVRVSAWVAAIPDDAGLGGVNNKRDGVHVDGQDGAGLPPPPSAEESWKRRSFFKDGVRRLESVEKGKGKTGDEDWMTGEEDWMMGEGDSFDEDEDKIEDARCQLDVMEDWLDMYPVDNNWHHFPMGFAEATYEEKKNRIREATATSIAGYQRKMRRNPASKGEYQRSIDEVRASCERALSLLEGLNRKELAKTGAKRATVEDAADEDANPPKAPRDGAPRATTAPAAAGPSTAPPTTAALLDSALQTINASLARLAASLPASEHLSHLSHLPALVTTLQQQQDASAAVVQRQILQQNATHPIALAAKHVAAMSTRKMSFRRKMDALVQFERDENKARVYLALGEAGDKGLQKAYLGDLIERERDERPWVDASEDEF